MNKLCKLRKSVKLRRNEFLNVFVRDLAVLVQCLHHVNPVVMLMMVTMLHVYVFDSLLTVSVCRTDGVSS